MAEFKVNTKNKVDIKSKPRVYFTCHPEDFEKYFKKICDDIFKTHDCAIYYTEDMCEKIFDEDKEIALNRNNLFVVPVTFKLLSTPNRAMDEDIPYAKEKHIPILPIMMEPGLDSFYSAPNKFGELQYLNSYSCDLTEISYEEKLKKYLESVLISDEMAKRVRAAFDAYIFLSYRKKDRRYANELMHLIHSYPECRDIAVWFDEFLTPGESFKENIKEILSKSKLFTLLVTPNLLEEPNGKPNFVMGEEYPVAKDSGIDILPAEMVNTNKTELLEKYENLPECANPYNDEEFKSRLLESIAKAAILSNNNEPEHNFLIGLAYLDGIDVETDSERGIELITSAAEAGLLKAMLKLCEIYDKGIGTRVNYSKVIKWYECVYTYCILNGVEGEQTLGILENLASSYLNNGEYQKALDLNKLVHKLYCDELGEKHPKTLASLTDLSAVYSNLGDNQKALELCQKAYETSCEVLGEEHISTLRISNNLAVIYCKLGDYENALKLQKKVYELSCKVLGEEHLNTVRTLSNLSSIYRMLDNPKNTLVLKKQVYEQLCKILGEEHPETLRTLGNLAVAYGDLGENQKFVELTQKVYEISCKVLGETHPTVLTVLNKLACTYSELGDFEKVLEVQQKVYEISCKVLGETHPDTIETLAVLILLYSKFGNQQKALELLLKKYEFFCKTLGEEHIDTLEALNNLVSVYIKLGEYKKALELNEKLYELRLKSLGEKHPDTISALNYLAYIYSNLKNYHKALEIQQKAYELRLEVLGEKDKATLVSLNNLAYFYKVVEDYKSALPLQQKLYDLRVKLLGEDHTETQKTLERLNEIKLKLNM